MADDEREPAGGVWLTAGELARWPRRYLEFRREAKHGCMAGHRHGQAFRDRIKADPFSTALAQGLQSGQWLPVDLSAPPRPGDVTFEQELARVRTVPPRLAKFDLSQSAGGRLLDAFDVSDPAPRCPRSRCAWSTTASRCRTANSGRAPSRARRWSRATGSPPRRREHQLRRGRVLPGEPPRRRRGRRVRLAPPRARRGARRRRLPDRGEHGGR